MREVVNSISVLEASFPRHFGPSPTGSNATAKLHPSDKNHLHRKMAFQIPV